MASGPDHPATVVRIASYARMMACNLGLPFARSASRRHSHVKYLAAPCPGLSCGTSCARSAQRSTTFAVAAISQASSRATFAASMFWTLIGIAGVLGIWSGWVIARLGLRRSHTLLLGGLAAATALIAAAPGWWPAVGVSAIIYGPVFMATSGLLAVWSYHVFPDRPAAGLNATVLFLGLGAVIGPALFGALADLWNLRPALLLVAAIAVATVGARPRTTTAHAAR
jgi:MFS family permease